MPRSPQEVRAERQIDRYERLGYAKQSAKDRGEAWLDRGDLKELRDAGNDYLTRERSLDGEMDRAIEHFIITNGQVLDAQSREQCSLSRLQKARAIAQDYLNKTPSQL